MKRQSIYLFRTRRPSGWGRHNGYVGRTSSPYHRKGQHLDPGPKQQPWSDLDPVMHVLITIRCPLFVIKPLEAVAIMLLLPVYNIQLNRLNPRRIKPWHARAQRAQRDARRATYVISSRVKDLVTVLPVLVVLACAAYFWTGVAR